MRPQVKLQPSVPKSSFMAWSCRSFDNPVRYFQPRSLNAPPMPSQFWSALVSSTVTVAVPLVASVHLASVFQYAPDADVTRASSTGGGSVPPPAPAAPPADGVPPSVPVVFPPPPPAA